MNKSPESGRKSATAPGRPHGATRLSKISLVLFCILLFCPAAGCSAGPGRIPAGLLEPTPRPEWHGSTMGDLVEYAQDLESALDSANADKAAAKTAQGQEVGIMGKND